MPHSDFVDLVATNRVYSAHFALRGLAAPAAKGLAVLTCIDSRIAPLAMLGLQPGDAKIVRNAGARATDDAIRSLMLAANLLGVYRIMVVAHTDCAVSGHHDDDLRTALGKLHPDEDLSMLELGGAPDALAGVREDVRRIRAARLMPAGVVVEGFRYDVSTGLLEFVPCR